MTLADGFVIFLLLVFCIYHTNGKIFFTTLIPNQYFPVKCLIVGFICYMTTMMMANICTMEVATFCYGFYLNVILIKELLLRRGNTRYITNDQFRESESIRNAYRSLQLLNANIFSFMGIYLMLCNALIMLASIYFNVAMIRYWNDLHFVTKGSMFFCDVVPTISWTLILEIGILFDVKGRKVLNSWRNFDWHSDRENRIMKKFCRSCFPILMAYGSMFSVKKAAIMHFYRGISRGTLRTLLTNDMRRAYM